jgi:hypothetical protein
MKGEGEGEREIVASAREGNYELRTANCELEAYRCC